jgi:hypothetical protein
MKLTLSTILIPLFAIAAATGAQTTVSSQGNNTHYTQAELKKLAQEASTPSQYATLAAYYAEQQRKYTAQAAEEKLEWARRSQNIMVVAAKYPRPVDSARYLYEYYTYKATEAGQLTAQYEQKAHPEPPPVAK